MAEQKSKRLTRRELNVIVDALEFVLAGEWSEVWPEDGQYEAAVSASQKCKERLDRPRSRGRGEGVRG